MLSKGVFIIDKARCSQPARRDFYPRFVRPFATRLVDNFCLFWGKNYSHSIVAGGLELMS